MVSTPPKLGAKTPTLRLCANKMACSAEVFKSTANIPVNPLICFFAISCPGSEGRPTERSEIESVTKNPDNTLCSPWGDFLNILQVRGHSKKQFKNRVRQKKLDYVGEP